jgi:hypothetical protein
LVFISGGDRAQIALLVDDFHLIPQLVRLVKYGRKLYQLCCGCEFGCRQDTTIMITHIYNDNNNDELYLPASCVTTRFNSLSISKHTHLIASKIDLIVSEQI